MDNTGELNPTQSDVNIQAPISIETPLSNIRTYSEDAEEVVREFSEFLRQYEPKVQDLTGLIEELFNRLQTNPIEVLGSIRDAHGLEASTAFQNIAKLNQTQAEFILQALQHRLNELNRKE